MLPEEIEQDEVALTKTENDENEIEDENLVVETT